jgi:two-component system, NtrC family, response regulator AtoC
LSAAPASSQEVPLQNFLAVLAPNDSFHQLWQQFATSYGVDLRLGATVASLGSIHNACCGIISAAGVEERAPALLREMRAGRCPPLCLVTTDTEYSLAVNCMREGADHYFVLPGDTGALRAWVGEQVERTTRSENSEAFAAELRKCYNFGRLVGDSKYLVAALEIASKVITRGTPTVLITGETGTGNDLLTQAIHYNGPRAAKPYIEINCTALPEHLLEAELFGYEAGAFTDARVAKPGLFEAADGGTLFLDEVGDLSSALQAKLLRVLEDRWIRRLGSIQKREIDVRIIAATNADLTGAIRDGKFRRDLHYRLNVYPIHLPPLRDRGDDILLLARHYLDEFAEEYRFSSVPLNPSIAKILKMHPWPGNVRELKNTMERAILLGDGVLRREHLFPDPIDAPRSDPSIPFPAPMEVIARAVAASTVTWCAGNKSQAAAVLEISRKRLYTLLNGETAEAPDATD